jgi:hypothetical protein
MTMARGLLPVGALAAQKAWREVTGTAESSVLPLTSRWS